MNIVKSAIPIEKTLKQFFLENYEPVASIQDPAERDAAVGGDLSYEKGMDFYIRIDKVASSADRFEGAYTVDVEVFGRNYLETESRALDIEALLLGYPHVVEVEGRTWVFDEVSQNSGPDELPWDDDEVSRLGATYVIIARRR